MALSSGTRIGLYEIVEPLGAGGMGEVYRARDTRLQRDVAFKILPTAFAADADRLARFEREAQLLASLNHPNIAVIHGLEESGGTLALVMELVEGETLTDRLARGPLPVDEALAIAMQIAEALDAAHEQGIVHRDLKPANIRVRHDGTVKVLDFGLAKLVGGGETVATGAALTMSPTVFNPPTMTQAGVLLGTAAYMSPEQARGRPADTRSDIWAFGVIVYEMVTGRPLFAGETLTDILASVVKDDPNFSHAPASLHPLLHACLQKDPKKRLRHIADLGLLLRPDVPAPAVRRRAFLPWAGTAVVVVAALAGIGTWRLRTATAVAPVPTRFVHVISEGDEFSALTRRYVAVAPDGRRFAYIASGRMYVRDVTQFDAVAVYGLGVRGSAAVGHMTFSPDGESLAFWGDGVMRRIAVAGGAAVTIAPVNPAPRSLDWVGNDLMFSTREGLMRVPANGGTPELLVAAASGERLWNAQMLPDGDHLLVSVGPERESTDILAVSNVVAISMSTKERQVVLKGTTDARYVRSGHLVFAGAGTLLAVPFDANRLAVTGGAVPVVEGVRQATGQRLTQFAVSDTGVLVFVPGATSGDQQRLAVVDRNGRPSGLPVPDAPYEQPRVSPDGRQILYTMNTGAEQSIWILDRAAGAAPRRLTFAGNNRSAIWANGGRQVIFQSDRDGASGVGLYIQPADGSSEARRLTTAAARTGHVPNAVSPDGRWLLYDTLDNEGAVTLMARRLDVDADAVPFGGVVSRTMTNAVFSPDGRWVAYSQFAAGEQAVYVQPFPATGAKYQISRNDDGHHPVFSRDGRELLYIPGPNQYASVAISTRPAFSFATPTPIPRGGFVELGPSTRRNHDLLPDGRAIGVVDSIDEGPARLNTRQVRVVLNWFEELKTKAPVRGD